MSLKLSTSECLFDEDWNSSIDDTSSESMDSHDSKRLRRDTSGSYAGPVSPLLMADIIESKYDFHIHCDLPGVDASDLHLSLEGMTLVIRAERRHVHHPDMHIVHSMERSFGVM